MSHNHDAPLGRHLLDRRGFLSHMATGVGGIALGSILAEKGLLAAEPKAGPLAPRPPHFAAKAKRVIHIYCTGAVSHLDTWDYKPELIKRHGEPMPGAEKLLTFQGENGALAKSPWAFKPRGECGKFASDLLPHLAERVDDMCFIHSLTSKTNTHGPGEMFMSTGFTLEGFPSMGAWVSYALGTDDQDLPAYVAIPDPRGDPQQGPANWTNGFLPAVYQGTSFNADKPIRHLARPESISPDDDRAARDLIRILNDEHLARNPGDEELSARIAAYELAARMQLSAPEVGDLSRESPAVRSLYGLDDANPILAGFGRNCLLARRLVERGVRFVTLFNGAFAMGEGALNWDGHRRIKSDYDRHGPILDKPAAALLIDLKDRGLLDDTLVVWSTEFGRMPTFQKGTEGRDHNPKGFTAWLAGAGVKRAFSYGATDPFGYQAVENVVDVHDFHATILHLLGLDHERLTYYNNGAQRRLTDVHGHVIRDILA
ncbi:MAG: sulfatase [Planctomycetales bacterium 71-10]|nr:MAG: sulfatase [Planctomycetales bacterium 71-10]